MTDPTRPPSPEFLRVVEQLEAGRRQVNLALFWVGVAVLLILAMVLGR